MGEKRYIISDASKLIEVESHVLRYWEDQLDIEIPRNEMGHRYYTDYYIELFKKIKELKDGGFQLKAIKMLIPELMNMYSKGSEAVENLRDELFCRLTEADELTGQDNLPEIEKEMDYLMHIREKQEEERFKKLDETIRNCQVSRRENAKIKKGIFFKIKRL